jgi:hypothetical protein
MPLAVRSEPFSTESLENPRQTSNRGEPAVPTARRKIPMGGEGFVVDPSLQLRRRHPQAAAELRLSTDQFSCFLQRPAIDTGGHLPSFVA